MKFLVIVFSIVTVSVCYLKAMSPTGALALIHLFNPELLEARFRCLTCGVFVPAAARKVEYVSGSRTGFLCTGCVQALERRAHPSH